MLRLGNLLGDLRAPLRRGGMEIFGRLHALRRRRNRTEYPAADSPGIDKDDARQALDTARAVLDAAERLLGSERLDVFD